jgi:hypothetical protein
MSYFNWLKEKRPVILFFRNYFSKEDIAEIDEDGRSKKYERLLFLENKLLPSLTKSIHHVARDFEFLDEFYLVAKKIYEKDETLKAMDVDEILQNIHKFYSKSKKEEVFFLLENDSSKFKLCKIDDVLVDLLYLLARDFTSTNDFKEFVFKM